MSRNFLLSYTNFATTISDAPEIFHNFMAYAVLASVVAPNVYFSFGDMKIRPNLFMLLLASSSRFRKSTVLSIGANLLRRYNSNLILPSEFTQEKILDVLQTTPTGVFVFYEFLSLMNLLSRDYNAGLKSFLTEIFDCPPFYSRKTRGGEINIENPVLTLLSATTIDWFVAKTKEGDIGGGFLSRFIFVPASKKEKDLPLPPPADDNERNKLIIMLEELSKLKGEFKLSPEAKKQYETWYRRQNALIDIVSPLLRGSMSRLQIYALKFAMLETINEGSGLIVSENAMLQALTRIDWLTRQTQNLIENELTFTRFGALLKKAVQIIQTHNGTGITRANLLKALDSDAMEVQKIVDTLEQREEIVIERRTVEGAKKPTTFYKIK